jgi:hypothetical protein
MKFRPLFVLLWGCVVPLAGCGDDGRPELVEVTGTVKINGEPVADALVYFMPLEGNPIMRPSRAETDGNGNFRLGTYKDGDGIPPGKYRIGIEKRQLVGELPSDYDPQSPQATRLTHQWITPKKLANPETSGLEAVVTQSGLEPAVFELTRREKPEFETTGG